MAKKKSIIYVNYSPYENSGKILDYILENFENVALFSIGFYNLKNKKSYNKLTIYKNGKQKKEFVLFNIPVIQSLVFLLLPMKSFISFCELIVYSIFLKQKFKKIDIYFTVNAFTAWTGMILKHLGIVDKTIFWVWDYYPPIHENKIIMLMRYIYWQFDKISSHSDRVAFVNHRLLDLRKDIGIYDKKTDYLVIPQGTDKLPFSYSPKKTNKIRLVFFGVLKNSHGVELVFQHAAALTKEFGKVYYDIVGSGPDEDYLKNWAAKSAIVSKFYGYLEDDSIDEVLAKCAIGIATYKPGQSSVSAYGDPGKIKRYLSVGIPVITTNILEFSTEIEKSGAGVIIEYGSKKALTAAIKKIMKNYAQYSKNAYALSQKYHFRKIYPQLFDNINEQH